MKDKRALYRKIKFIVTIIIISGVAIHLFLVYSAAKSLQTKEVKIIGIYPISLDEYEIRFILTLYNPKNTEIEVDYISYSVYIENEFVGYGEKPHFIIKPGIHNYTFLFSFSILNLSSVTKSLILAGENIDVKIKGDVIIPAKFLGLFTWRYIRLPYEAKEKLKIG